MARVNHRKLKQLLNEKRSKISDRQFFSSRILAGHYEDLAAAQTRRYKYNRRIHVNLIWEPKNEEVACTNNLSVLINCGHKLVTKRRSRMDRYEIVTGLFAHELGHCLYTDFLSAQTYDRFLSRSKWYPYASRLSDPEDRRRETELIDYISSDPKHNEMLRYVAHQIANVLEDGYVESRILYQFPGSLGYGLESLRQEQLSSMQTLTQMIEQEDDGSRHVFETILQLILSYVKYGELKYGDESLSDERVQAVFGLITELDSALIEPSGKERWNVVNIVLIRLWDYLKGFLELCEKRQEQAAAAGVTSTLAQTMVEMLQSIAGGSASGTGDSTPVPEAGAKCHASNSAARTATRAKATENGPEEEGKTEDASSQTESETEADSSEDSQTESEAPENPQTEMANPGLEERAGKQDTSAEEKGRLPRQNTDTVSTPSGGSVEKNEEYVREHNEHAASDIERMLDKMAERAACEQLESERLRELNDAAQNISYGNIHSGVNVRVNRITEVDEELVEQYDQAAPPLLTISRQLQKHLTQQLKDKRRGGKQTGLVMGRRLEVHALCRNDGKVFYKNALPAEIPEMAVALLLDESGSMCSRDRSSYARASAIILYDFCKSLRIPVMIYGHSTGSNSVELYSYAEFDAIDNDDKYRLMDIAARSSNRDGAALRFIAEQLIKRPEDVKLLILVSDGQPADYGYYGTAAEEDLRGIKQEYRRKGILFLAAAIGDDKQNIERIYGDAFLDITDLTQLPVKLTTAVKRFIRV